MREEREYRALFAVDIERSAGRGDAALLQIRSALGVALRESFERSGIDWERCLCDDLGDGMQVTAPAGLPKTKLIHPLIHELDARIQAHNKLAGRLTRIRVRIALHAGDVHVNTDGRVVGSPLEVLARLLNAAPTRSALAQAPDAAAALILSQHFYDETVCHGCPGIDPADFRGTTVREKEYTASAWLHVPGRRELVPSPEAAQPAETAEGAQDQASGRPDLRRMMMKNKASGNGVINATQNGTQTIHINSDNTSRSPGDR